MNYKRIYYILIALLPILYIIHNIEEWLLLNQKIDDIVVHIPRFLSHQYKLTADSIISIFGIAIVVASILPFVILPFLLGELTSNKIKIALVVIFATLINAASHITSSIFLGFISPGFFSALILLLPYCVLVIYISRKIIRFKLTTYLFLLILSLPVYLSVLAISWLVGVLLV